jgi:hypothetical protein
MPRQDRRAMTGPVASPIALREASIGESSLAMMPIALSE